MSASVDELVTPADLILDHARRRVGCGLVAEPARSARLISPTCGDVITVAFAADSTVPSWDGRGCEVSQASASMLAELSAEEGVSPERIAAFLAAMSARGATAAEFGDADALLTLAGNVVRAKCATLAWRAARDALAQ